MKFTELPFNNFMYTISQKTGKNSFIIYSAPFYTPKPIFLAGLAKEAGCEEKDIEIIKAEKKEFVAKDYTHLLSKDIQKFISKNTIDKTTIYQYNDLENPFQSKLEGLKNKISFFFSLCRFKLLKLLNPNQIFYHTGKSDCTRKISPASYFTISVFEDEIEKAIEEFEWVLKETHGSILKVMGGLKGMELADSIGLGKKKIGLMLGVFYKSDMSLALNEYLQANPERNKFSYLKSLSLEGGLELDLTEDYCSKLDITYVNIPFKKTLNNMVIGNQDKAYNKEGLERQKRLRKESVTKQREKLKKEREFEVKALEELEKDPDKFDVPPATDVKVPVDIGRAKEYLHKKHK